MIINDTIMLRIINWIAGRLGLDLGFGEGGIFDSLDEREITEQLRFGRD